MDQTKLRKGYPEYRHSAYSNTLPSAQKTGNKTKSRHKNNDQQMNFTQTFDPGFNPYAFNVPPQARIHPSAQRLFTNSDPSVCHYSVPLSFSLEHVSLPLYSTLLQPGAASTPPPLQRLIPINRSNEHSKIPAIFQAYKQHNEVEQDFMSLPPANCDINSKKTRDEDSTCKRRFSDPGVAQISSDECSSTRSSGNSNNSSIKDFQNIACPYDLMEQLNELKENNSQLTKELHETKLELESLKVLSASWRPYSENLQPGNLSDSIVEVRKAIKVNEEAMMTKMENLFEKNSTQCNEVHRKLEEKLSDTFNERLAKLEDQVRMLSENTAVQSQAPIETRPATEDVGVSCSNKDVISIQQQLVDSERERLLLRKELQEAIDSRKKAESNTLKLERLVSLLRKKINGVSLESCISDEKQNQVRPLASSLEQNPFIIANNKHSQKPGHHQKRSSGPRKQYSDPEVHEIAYNHDGKENESCESNSNGSGSPVNDVPASMAPQVTITGPVTDL